MADPMDAIRGYLGVPQEAFPAEELKECIGAYTATDLPCRGKVTTRESFGGTTTVDECVAHMERSRRRNEELQQQYPDSDIPPAWFGPVYGDGTNEYGERWNPED